MMRSSDKDDGTFSGDVKGSARSTCGTSQRTSDVGLAKWKSMFEVYGPNFTEKDVDDHPPEEDDQVVCRKQRMLN